MMKANRIPTVLPLLMCLLLSTAWIAAGEAPNAAPPSDPVKLLAQATDETWIPALDAEYLSAMLAAYETTAFAAQPLMQKSESMSMRIMAEDRVREMKKMAKKIFRVMQDKKWKIDNSIKKEADAKMAELITANNGVTDEMGLLAALKQFHVLVAMEAVNVMGMTDDYDVAEISKDIVRDQMDSIITAQRMPELIKTEATFTIGRPPANQTPANQAPAK